MNTTESHLLFDLLLAHALILVVLQSAPQTLRIEVCREPLRDRAKIGIEQHDEVLLGAQEYVLAVGRELHLLDLLGLALDRERLKWLVLVVFRVEKVDHLVQDLKRVCTLALIFLLVHTNRLVVRSHEETGKELSHVVKAGSLAPIELDQTLFLLVFPDSRRAIEGHTQERSILRI